MDKELEKILIFTYNPKGRLKNCNIEEIENTKVFDWFRTKKHIIVEKNQVILIYISKPIQEIKYLTKVIDINKDTIKLKLIKKFNKLELSYEKLIENGLKEGSNNIILNNNEQLYKYIKGVLSNELSNKSESKNMKTKNIMLYGSPGVGKTYNYKKLIALIEGNGFDENRIENGIFDFIINNKDYPILEGLDEFFETIKNEKRIEFVTFHQSYSYEDFIEGFRPQDNGNIKLEDGIFKTLCEKANKNPLKNFYIVIDEINRGNISKIFGELITLIEEDKRDAYEVTLPYSKEKFKIPSNLYIIATMNSTDKSIATIDIALRRRFTFLKMKPNLDLVENQGAKDLMKELNKHISNAISEDYALGHSYFMKIENEDDLKFVKEYKVKPLLEEYFYGDEDNYKKALKILGFEDELNKQ